MSKERYCTIPAIFGLREWFEHRHHEICKKHDEEYVATLNPFKKLWSDVKVITWLALDAFLSLGFFIGALFVLPTLGTIYWVYKRTKERL